MKFSVLLPIYNKDFLRSSIRRCMSEICSNSLPPAQIVVVVDGPLDWDLDEQLIDFRQKIRLDIYHLPERGGLTKALNFGLSKCVHDFVARVDADDFCHHERFEMQCRLAIQGYNIIGSDIEERDEYNNFVAIKHMPTTRSDIYSYAKRRNPFNHMTVFFEKKLVLDVGGYPDFFLKEDYALWVMLLAQQAVKPINIPSCLMVVTAGDNMYRRRSSYIVAVQELKFQMLLFKVLDKSLFLCIYDGLVRCLYLFLPFTLKRFFYLNVLRNK